MLSGAYRAARRVPLYTRCRHCRRVMQPYVDAGVWYDALDDAAFHCPPQGESWRQEDRLPHDPPPGIDWRHPDDYVLESAFVWEAARGEALAVAVAPC